jgi:hypothetical protein
MRSKLSSTGTKHFRQCCKQSGRLDPASTSRPIFIGQEPSATSSRSHWRPRPGVEVPVNVDGVGSLPFHEDLIHVMTTAGVRFERYRPLRWYTLDRVNNRTHRKLLIVDGRVAFTGGVGIADNWRGNARKRMARHALPDRRTRRGRIPGGVRRKLAETTGETLQGAKFCRAVAPAGGLDAQLILSSQPTRPHRTRIFHIEGCRRQADGNGAVAQWGLRR